MWGVRGRALSHPRMPALWAGCPGPLPTGCHQPVTNPKARALARWLCTPWGRHEGARGGRLLPGCGASGVGRSPTPDCPPFGWAAGGQYPLAVGAGECWRRDPSPTPQRVLLRAGFARCGGGTRAPGGGASCLGVGRPGSGALQPPTARPLGGLPGPTTHALWVRGSAGVGTRHQPHSARSCVLWGRREGARGGRLLPVYGASRVGRSPTPNCPPSGRAGGAHYPLAVDAGGCGRGDPSPTPQRALLRAGFPRCGGGTRAPGGGASCLGMGRPGSGGSHPRLPALWAGCRGPLPTCCGCGGVRAWGPVPNPTARALACCRGGMRVPGGGACCLGVERPGSGALPPPTTRPLGGLPGPTTHWLWVRGGAGVGTRHQPHSARSCELALRAVGAARGHSGGAPPAWVWGVPGRALSHSRLPALSAGCWGPLPTGCGCGVVRAWGPVTNPTARALARCGGGMGVPGGGAPLAWVWGVRGRALSQLRLPALWAGCRGPLPTGCGCGGVQAWGPVTDPTARALASWLCPLWGRHEGARGCASCLGVGRPGSGAPPAPAARPLGGLPGPTTHWL